MAYKITATEFATFPISIPQADATPLQEASFRDNLPQVAGYHGGLWGYQIEDPTKLHWFLNWTDINAHQAYMSSPAYANLVGGIGAFSGPPSLHHASIPLVTAPMGKAPVLEWIVIQLAADTDKDEWAKGFDSLVELLDETASEDRGFYGIAGGWGIENQRSFTVLIGWESKEAHTTWKENCSKELLAKGMKMFKEGVKSIELVHVKVGGRVDPKN
ncbi:hypothetical protein EDC01DRAFT_784752 [Geopyxis carbonaria]|nr:hypothetical protein EDC01DRAFT_784752 [Geopyxis carbonaria]